MSYSNSNSNETNFQTSDHIEQQSINPNTLVDNISVQNRLENHSLVDSNNNDLRNGISRETSNSSTRKRKRKKIEDNNDLVVNNNNIKKLNQSVTIEICHRCQLKKIDCDGFKPTCFACNELGFDCKYDKPIVDEFNRPVSSNFNPLQETLRYTDILESKIKDLESDIRKLRAICNLNEQNLQLIFEQNPTITINNIKLSELDKEDITKTALKFKFASNINKTESKLNKGHICDGLCKHSNLHTKPVATSFNLNDPTSISFEQNQAPGLIATRAINTITKHNNSTQLAILVSLSVPRSTEEILMVPNLLNKIKKFFGFTSKQCLYTVTLLSSLKDDLPVPFTSTNVNRITSDDLGSTKASPPSLLLPKQLSSSSSANINCLNHDSVTHLVNDNITNFENLKNNNLWSINNLNELFYDILKLNIFNPKIHTLNDFETNILVPPLDFDDIDELVNLFFQYWADLIPVLNEREFRNLYKIFQDDIKLMNNNLKTFTEMDNTVGTNKFLNIKFFACMLAVICQLGNLAKYNSLKNNSKVKNSNSANNGTDFTSIFQLQKRILYYHKIMYIIPQNSFFNTATTSIRILQLLCLIEYYFLNIGDIVQLYNLRGTIISMSQQLRLHRCPSAVLTGSGNKMNKLEQSNRRRLFWSTYYLDVFASLQLGVPRLYKDHEIECALPLVREDDNINVTAENSNDRKKLKTSKGSSSRKNSLANIKLEGHLSPFSLAIIRFAKILGNILDTVYKRNMTQLITEKVANIHEEALTGWKDSLDKSLQFTELADGTVKTKNQPKPKLNLIALYWLAKCMIRLPLCTMPQYETRTLLDSNQTLFETSNCLLAAFRTLSKTYIALPINASRTIARFSLVSAKELLEKARKGKDFEETKSLLLHSVKDIEDCRKLDFPGVMSWYTLKMLDVSINLLLETSSTDCGNVEKFLQAKKKYYDVMLGKTDGGATSNDNKIISDEKKDRIVEQNDIKLEPEDFKRNILKHEEKTVPEFTDADKRPNPTNLDSVKNIADSQSINTTEFNQNAFAQALNLDPILNTNLDRFSNTDLLNFFNNQANYNLNSNNLRDSIVNKDTAIDDVNNTILQNEEAKNKTSVQYGLERENYHNKSIPSLFLNNNNDLGGLSLEAIYSNNSNNINFNVMGNTMNPDSTGVDYVPDLGGFIDASLGLAPILSEYGDSMTDRSTTNDNKITSPSSDNYYNKKV